MEDQQTLLAGVDPRFEVLRLDAARDGVRQLAEALAGRSGLDAIHLISHGSQGTLQLGSTLLTTQSMTSLYAGVLASIGQALTDEGDLLIYGCNFGEGVVGQEAASWLATLTWADVSASLDATGHATLGGDWDLESHTGLIETTVAIGEETQVAWGGSLATFTVTTTLDLIQPSIELPPIAAPGSLRAAIEAANNVFTNPGLDTITFAIPGPGAKTIFIGGFPFYPALNPLPSITNPVIINGTTQPGLELNGTSAGAGAIGLFLGAGSSGSTIRGLTINRFGSSGIWIENSGSHTIQGNFIGTDVTATIDLGNGGDGITIFGSSNNNTIGGTTSTARNVISGNQQNGIKVNGGSANVIQGNYIGTNFAGTGFLGNSVNGVELLGPSNQVGGQTPESRNIISGNGFFGVSIYANGNNVVEGNYIGTDVNGTVDLGNGGYGVILHGGATNNRIGGTTTGSRNVISGNQLEGVHINGSTGNLVQGNYIGTNAAGTAALGNTGAGVFLNGAANNTIGGTTATPGTGAGNVISGNLNVGFGTQGASGGSTVRGNLIGTNAAGTGALGNGSHGVLIAGAPNLTIGGTTATPGTGQGNVISGNNGVGVLIVGTGTIVSGNVIGANATGTAALANAQDGVTIGSQSTSNTIGGATTAHRNLISGNGGDGIELAGELHRDQPGRDGSDSQRHQSGLRQQRCGGEPEWKCHWPDTGRGWPRQSDLWEQWRGSTDSSGKLYLGRGQSDWHECHRHCGTG